MRALLPRQTTTTVAMTWPTFGTNRWSPFIASWRTRDEPQEKTLKGICSKLR